MNVDVDVDEDRREGRGREREGGRGREMTGNICWAGRLEHGRNTDTVASQLASRLKVELPLPRCCARDVVGGGRGEDSTGSTALAAQHMTGRTALTALHWPALDIPPSPPGHLPNSASQSLKATC